MDQRLISTPVGPDEAFARLNAGLTALGYESRFTPEEKAFVFFVNERISEEIRFSIESSGAASLVTLFLDKVDSRLDQEEAGAALEAFVREGKSHPVLKGVTLPEPPFVTVEMLTSPYPRIAARRRGFFRAAEPQSVTFDLNRAGELVGTRFDSSEDDEEVFAKLHAFAQFLNWRSIESVAGEIRFCRGAPNVQLEPDFKAGHFDIPAVMTFARVMTDRKSRWEVTISFWASLDATDEVLSLFQREIMDLRAYLRAGIRPDRTLKNAMSRVKVRRVTVTSIVSRTVFVASWFLLATRTIPEFYGFPLVFLAILVIARLEYRPVRDGVQSLEPSAYSHAKRALPFPPPKWVNEVWPKVLLLQDAWRKNPTALY